MDKEQKQAVILSLGSVNADFQVRVDRKPGSTTTMLTHDFTRLSGGKAANVAFMANLLGASASVIAHVGDDDLQQQALVPLQEKGIDLSHVQKVAGVTTGFSVIAVPADGKKYIMLSPNANDNWQQEDLEKVGRTIREAPEGSLLVVDYEVPPFVVEHAIAAARACNLPVILDPSPPERVDEALLSKVDYIVPDASESEELTNILPDSVENALKAARKLVQLGVKHALVKLEDGGCVATDGETALHVPPLSLEVVDTTGAGDAFAGALAVAVLEKRSLKDAACFATAASLAAVTTYGSQPAYPSRERLEQLFNRLREKVQDLHEH